MHIVVLGAGIAGISAAWFLRQSGHDVTVIERHPYAACETSFGNGGQLSVSQSEPWATPDTLWHIAPWLFQNDAPLLFRPQFDPHQWRWILEFLRECLPQRQYPHAQAMIALGLYSRQAFADIAAEVPINYHRQNRGILCLYRQRTHLKSAQRLCQFMQAQGVNRQLISTENAIAIEPALKPVAHQFVGASFCAEDASGDVKLFTRALAEAAQLHGVQFKFNHHIQAMQPEGRKIQHVSLIASDGSYQTIHADAYLVALGSYSPTLLRPLGIHVPIYPTKGYSATLSLRDPTRAPQVSLTDEHAKVVFSRLGDQLRVAGTAELAGYTRTLHLTRCQALIKTAQYWFPDALDLDSDPHFWSGLRPATPSNVACVGRTARFDNLYLNTGHGTLGWTQGPGSGRAIAEIINGHRPPITFPFLGLSS